MKRTTCIALAGLVWPIACGGDKAASIASGGAASDTAQAGSDSTSGGVANDPDGAPTGGQAGQGGNGGQGGNEATPDPVEEDMLVPLENGSRQHRGVLNLVDATAAQNHYDFMHGPGTQPLIRMVGLQEAVNRFLDFYEDEYDFLYFVSESPYPDSTLAGAFQPVNRDILPGTGNDILLSVPGYASSGKLKGVVGLQYRDGAGPLSHELMHYWANRLDESFGFGQTREGSVGPHWGMSSVHGQLGGFDLTTLRCATPAGGQLGTCTPEADGRTRYTVAPFYPHDNSSKPFAPFELYLMGFVPATEAPTSFTILEDAEIEYDSIVDGEPWPVTAAGHREVQLSEIIAKHGQPALATEAERHFDVAFIVVSESPVSDDKLDHIADVAAEYGGRAESTYAFREVTQGLGSINTELGQRRRKDSPKAPPATGVICDAFAQDCPGDLACRATDFNFCVRHSSAPIGAPCTGQQDYSCQPGSTCYRINTGEDIFRCTEYCDPLDPASEKACATLCPGNTTRVSVNDEVRYGVCRLGPAE